MIKYGLLANLLLAVVLIFLFAIPIYGDGEEQTVWLLIEGMT